MIFDLAAKDTLVGRAVAQVQGECFHATWRRFSGGFPSLQFPQTKTQA